MSNEVIEVEYKVFEESSLDNLIARIKSAEAMVYKVTLSGVIEIGQCLKLAKKKVDHGEWKGWCSDNLGYSQRQVQRFMQISEEYGDKNSAYSKATILSDLSISKALRLLQVPENEVESFIENNDVEDMTVNELEEKIKELNRKNRDQETTIECLETSEKSLYAQIEELKNKAEAGSTEAIDKAKSEIVKLKEKLKSAKADAESISEKAVQAATSAAAEKHKADLSAMNAEIERLERRLQASENQYLVRFGILSDELQTINNQIKAVIADADGALSEKMSGAYQKLLERMRCE